MGSGGRGGRAYSNYGGGYGYGYFHHHSWRTEGRKAAADQPPTNPVARQQPPMKETDPAATEASQGYPDKAILNVTLAELKAAPDFQYGPSPLSQAETQPAAGSDQMKKTIP